DVAPKLLVALLNQRPRGLEPGERVVGEHDQRAGREVVRERCRLVEEQRQVVLDAGRQLGLGDVAVDRAAARLDREAIPEARAEALDAFLVERELARRQDAYLRGLPRRELRLRIERPERIDLVVEQIDPD